MATTIKRFLVGRALRTEQAAHERLTKKTALAVFSSDALSSTAYATEEILLVLAAAAAATSGASFNYVIPSLAERRGNFSELLPKTLIDPLTRLPFAGNVIPSARISAQAQSLYLPL